MSLFKIKLKTKNGNEVKKKQVFNVLFKTMLRKNEITGKTKGYYSFLIVYNNSKVYNPKKVFILKESTDIQSKNDLIAKVILNLLTIVSKITESDKVNPDFILINSDDFDKDNRIYSAINAVTSNKGLGKKRQKRIGIGEGDSIEMIEEYVQLNSTVAFRVINPQSDPVKYKKSLDILKVLDDRIKDVVYLKNITNE